MRDRIVAAAPTGFQQGLGISFEIDGDAVLARLTADPHVCSRPGRVDVGVLATLADCAAGLRTLHTIEPGWTATMVLSTHALEPHRHPDLTATAEVAHRRRSGVVIDVAIRDGLGTRVATAMGSFAEMTREHSGLEVALAGAAPLDALGHAAGLRAATAADTLGIRQTAPHRFEIDLLPVVRNTAHALIGGATALFAEKAAVRAARHADPRIGRASSVELHYLGPGRVGPIVAATEVLDPAGDPPTRVRVRMTDAGAGDRAVATALVAVTDR